MTCQDLSPLRGVRVMEKVFYVKPGVLNLPEVLGPGAFPLIWDALGIKKQNYPALLPKPEKHMTLGEARRLGLLDGKGTPVAPDTVDWRWDPVEGRIISANGYGEVGVLCVVKQDEHGKDYVSHTSHYINEGPEVLRVADDPKSTIPVPHMAGTIQRAPSLSIATIEFVGKEPYLHLRFQWRTFMQQYAASLAGGYWEKGMTWAEAITAEVKDELGGEVVRLINNPETETDTLEVWLNRARNVKGIRVPIVVATRMDELPPLEAPKEDEEFDKIRLALPLMSLDHVQLPDNYCEAAKNAAINLHVRGKLH